MKEGTRVKVLELDDKDRVGSPWLQEGMKGKITVNGSISSYVMFEGEKRRTALLFNYQLEEVAPVQRKGER